MCSFLLDLHDRVPPLLPDLLPIQQQHRTDDLPALPPHKIDGAPDGSPGRRDVIEDHDALALDGRADEHAALAVVLGLLPVVREPDVDLVLAVEEERGPGREGDALVRRSEEDVEFGERARRERAGDRRSIRGTNSVENGARSEEAGVEEVGRRTVRVKRAREIGSLE